MIINISKRHYINQVKSENEMDLSQYLKDHGISNRQFALKLGVMPLTIGDIVRKKRIPTLEMAIKIETETYGKVTCKDLVSRQSIEIGKKKQSTKTKDKNEKPKLGIGQKTIP